jgi:hypothetical protein
MVTPRGADQITLPPAITSSPEWSPGRDEAWWWLFIPIACSAVLFVINLISADFYENYILPEGYGFLEFTQFAVLVAGFFISLALFRFRVIRTNKLLTAAAIIFALTCLFIAGEEMSWGQHFFYWSTPDYWAAINRQDETNLHNVSPWFNQRPRLVIEIGIFVGAIVLPLWQLAKGPFTHPLLALFAPPVAALPVGLTYLLFKAVDHVTKRGHFVWILGRPNEAVESVMYLFILYYLIIFYRRIRLLDSAGVERLSF